MPKAIKKRVVKKAALKEEAVKNIFINIGDVLREKKKIFAFAVMALIATTIFFTAFLLYQVSQKKKAYALEQEAYKYYYALDIKTPLSQEERLKKAMELYTQAIKIKSTPTAQFYLGNCYYQLGDYNSAIKAYTAFLDKYQREKSLVPLVYQKLAASYLKAGKPDEALKALEKLGQFNKGIFKDTALIEEARLYEATGKPDEAKKKYNELITNFPESIWASEARAKAGG
jgi:tetratricopeptide (TPR) repeat protein